MSRRQLIYVPEINPNTFVFFFYKGTSGNSWSIRDYMQNPVVERYARDFGLHADKVMDMARRPGCFAVPAEAHQVGDWHYWNGQVTRLNRQFLSGSAGTAPVTPPVVGPATVPQKARASVKATHGSQYRLQRYVDEQPDEITVQIIRTSPVLGLNGFDGLSWKSPLQSENFKEYQDDFLIPLGLQTHQTLLRSFWPRNGPSWDALGVLKSASQDGALLVEAKAHPGETVSHCGAKDPKSIALIDTAFGQVRNHMGAGASDWKQGGYQLANRLAYLYFLNEVVKVPTWLALVYFVNDTSYRPTSRTTWETHHQQQLAALGLRPGCPLWDRIIPVFVDALP
jgi:hypothetical protein